MSTEIFYLYRVFARWAIIENIYMYTCKENKPPVIFTPVKKKMNTFYIWSSRFVSRPFQITQIYITTDVYFIFQTLGATTTTTIFYYRVWVCKGCEWLRACNIYIYMKYIWSFKMAQTVQPNIKNLKHPTRWYDV